MKNLPFTPVSSSTSWFPPSAFDAVVIGCSAGGLKALKILLSGLPPFFPAPLIVVQHRLDREGPDYLPLILSHHGVLAVKRAIDGERLRPAIVYVAPPGRHVTMTADRTIALADSPKMNFVRPSIDVLFHSAARVCGARAIAVILTGAGSDGAKGAKAMKQAGATVIAQDRESSEWFEMPAAALATGAVDLCLPIGKIAKSLVALTMVPGAPELFRAPLPIDPPKNSPQNIKPLS